jgi:hypothetical protein
MRRFFNVLIQIGLTRILTLLDFGFEFSEIFVIEYQLPAINDGRSRRLRVMLIQRVNDSAYC